LLVVIVLVFMIVIVPIAIGVPAMIVFVPPAMIHGIAVLALFVQLVSPVVGFAAVRAVMLDGLVELVVNFREALLAIVSAHDWCGGGEGEESYEHGNYQRNFAAERDGSHWNGILFLLLRAGLQLFVILIKSGCLRYPGSNVEIYRLSGRLQLGT
jgi:hypothetical protein